MSPSQRSSEFRKQRVLMNKLIQEQYRQLLKNPNLSRAECEYRFPELIAYILKNVSLIDLLRSQGIEARPLSPDAPNVYIAEESCPCCGGDIVKE